MTSIPNDEIQISTAFNKLPDGFDYTVRVKNPNYKREDDDAMMVLMLGMKFVQECRVSKLDVVEQIKKIAELTPAFKQVELTLGQEVRADADRELEEREAADDAEDRYLDQLDTLGGSPPNDRVSNERMENEDRN